MGVLRIRRELNETKQYPISTIWRLVYAFRTEHRDEIIITKSVISFYRKTRYPDYALYP